MQKTQMFLKENIPEEVQNSSVVAAIKNMTDDFVASSNEQIAKMTKSFNNSTLATAIRISDSVFAELSFSNLENAKKILGTIR